MDVSRAATHRTIVYVDVESFGDPRRNRQALLGVRAGLWATMKQAFLDAGIPWSDCHTQDCGDGILVLAPGEPKSPFAEALPTAMARALREHNATHPEHERIRLRMALHAGEVTFDATGFTGHSLVHAARLLGADPVRATLKASDGVLVLVASQWFYDEVISQSDAPSRHGYRAVQVRVKETVTTGWISLPGHSRPRAKPAGKTLAAAAAATALVLAASLAADARTVGADSAPGADYPVESEFVAKVVNLRSGKCISRNGAYSQDDESKAERVGEPIYQWDCAEPDDDPGHTLVLAPSASGWVIRSSIRTDLCLAADGAPGQEQRFQVCRPQDSRQRWRLRRVSGQPPGIMTIENENTGKCVALAGPDPNDIRLGQAGCESRGTTEWEIRRYPGVGESACRDGHHRQLHNHETRSPAPGEDGRPTTVSLTTAARSAQGCATAFTDSSGRCLGVAAAAVQWRPCSGRSDEWWVIEAIGVESGLSWVRIHSFTHLAKCLQPDGLSWTTRRCGTAWLQQWHLG